MLYYEFDLRYLANRSFFINPPLNLKNLEIKVAKLITGSGTQFCPSRKRDWSHRALPGTQEREIPFAGYKEMMKKPMVEFQVSKTILSLPIPGNKHFPECSYEHLGFIYNLLLEPERIFSLSNANLNDVKTSGQILENTFSHCTVVQWLMWGKTLDREISSPSQLCLRTPTMCHITY